MSSQKTNPTAMAAGNPITIIGKNKLTVRCANGEMVVFTYPAHVDLNEQIKLGGKRVARYSHVSTHDHSAAPFDPDTWDGTLMDWKLCRTVRGHVPHSEPEHHWRVYYYGRASAPTLPL